MGVMLVQSAFMFLREIYCKGCVNLQLSEKNLQLSFLGKVKGMSDV